MNFEKNNGDASSILSSLIATKGVASTSSIADSEMCHSDLELTCVPEKTRMKKEECHALEIINEDHSSQNNMITPLIIEPVTELNPDQESLVSHLNSEPSAPQEKMEKRKLKKMMKELGIDGKDPVSPVDALITSTLIETDAVARVSSTTVSGMCHSGTELICKPKKTKRKKEKRSTLKRTNEDHNPQNDAAIRITPLINEPVTELNPETDSQVSHLNSEISAPQEKKEKKKPKKMKKELGTDGKDPVPPEDALVTSSLVVTDALACISSTIDSEMCHSGSELICKPEKSKRKKEKCSTLKLTNEDHNPQNDTATKITPLINEPVTVTELNPETDSQVSHLNSELSAPQEKKKKKKPKKMKKELSIDGKEPVPPEEALITTTHVATDAVARIRSTTDSGMAHSGSELICKPEKTKTKKEQNSTDKLTNEDHNPQNDAAIKITPLITEPVTVTGLNPETDSQVSHLNSELSGPQEKKEKRKPKKMKKELRFDGKDNVLPKDALITSSLVATDAVAHTTTDSEMCYSGSELTCIPEKTERKKENRSTLKITNEDHNPQNDAAIKITPLTNEPVTLTELNAETDSQVSHLNSELSSPQEMKSKKKRKKLNKMRKELDIDGKDLVPPECPSLNSTPVAAEVVARISSTTDLELPHSDSELPCTPEKTKKKKVKRSTLIITNEDNNPQNAADIMITPLINESVTELDPERDSQVSHLNSELRSPQEKKGKKKRKVMETEPNMDGKDPVPLESASPAKATLPVRDAEISLRPKADSEEIPLDSDLSCPQEKRRKRMELQKNNNSLEVNPSSDSFSEDHISDGPLILHPSPERVHLTHSKKKLLVLDLNGLLADIVPLLGRKKFNKLGEKAVCGKPFYHMSQGYKPYGRVGDKTVFKRPFCDEFLEFCFRNFNVAVWSSRTKTNTNQAVNLLLRHRQRSLIFCWDRSKCTITDFKTIENREKPIVLKELRKVWKFCREKWSWKEFDESNTLLVDDSPYKALCNPAYTAIFPYSYEYTDQADCSLSRNGDLRQYLEKCAHADDVRKFVKDNPFGQRAITDANLSWTFYKRIIDSVSEKEPNAKLLQEDKRQE